MSDSRSDLEIIRTEVYGEPVRASIANELEGLAVGVADISEELETIRTGRYGIDIRMAIYHALLKLHLNPPSPSPTSLANSVLKMKWKPVTVNHAIVAQMHRVFDWYCDADWFFSETTTADIGGRGYLKNGNYPAIGFVCQLDVGYTTLMLISDSADAVNNGLAAASTNTVSFLDKTWYYTKTDYAMGGLINDGLNHFRTFPELLTYDSSVASISGLSVLRVLDYVNLTVNE